MLTVPFWVFTIVALGLGIGLMNAALTVRYRDVGNIAGVLMAFLLYASPIAYSVQSVPADHRTLFLMNPVASLLAGFRWAVFGKGLVPWGWVLYSVVFTIATIIVGALVFKSRERKFADVI
jgi:lipopolysaccharide transport system permease protein